MSQLIFFKTFIFIYFHPKDKKLLLTTRTIFGNKHIKSNKIRVYEKTVSEFPI